MLTQQTFQRFCAVDMTLRCLSMSNWNNVVYVNIGIYNVEQRRTKVVYFKFDVNKVRVYRNNFVPFLTLCFTALINVETMLWIWPFVKSWKINLDFGALNKYYFKMNTVNSKFWLLFQNLIGRCLGIKYGDDVILRTHYFRRFCDLNLFIEQRFEFIYEIIFIRFY